MLRTFTPIFVSFLFISCSNNEKEIKKILDVNNKLVYYKVKAKTKRLFKNDTISNTYEVCLKKNNKDTIYGYDFCIKHTNYLFYNTNNLSCYFMPNNKTYLKITGKKSEMNKLLLQNNLFNTNDINDTIKFKFLENNKNYTIKIKHKSSKDFSNIESLYRVSQSTHLISTIITNVDFQNTNQYEKYIFKNHSFDSSRDISKEMHYLMHKYKQIGRTSSNKKNELMKKVESIDFGGSLINSKRFIHITDFDYDILILDYWYMSCYPCIKSIPLMNRISSKYNNRGVKVVGVNIIDNKQENILGLKKHMLSNKMNYPTLFTKENPYRVSEYPTVIIIDKMGKVVYTATGYSTKNEKDLINVIDNELLKTATNKGNRCTSL